MIITSSSFLLSAQTASPSLSNPRIGWQNFLFNLSADDLTVSGEASDGPKDAVLVPDTSEYWRPDVLPAWMLIDLGVARTINYVGLVGSFGSSRCAVKVQVGSDPNFETSAIFAAEIVPDNDAPLLFLDSDKFGRYIRIDLTGSTPPILPVVYAGAVLAMQNKISGSYTPISMGRKTVLKRNMSRDGQFLGQSFRRNGVTSDASFRFLTEEWVRAYFEPFSKHARGLPYFFAWNPLEFPREVGFCWSDKDITASYSGFNDYMEVSWRMDGIGSND